MEKSVYYQEGQQPQPASEEPKVKKARPQQHVRAEGDFFGMFNCCQNVPVEHEHETMVHSFPEPPEPESKSRYNPKNVDPYMSVIRMKNRQNQPNNIYNDQLVSEKLTQSRWKYL